MNFKFFIYLNLFIILFDQVPISVCSRHKKKNLPPIDSIDDQDDFDDWNRKKSFYADTKSTEKIDLWKNDEDHRINLAEVIGGHSLNSHQLVREQGKAKGDTKSRYLPLDYPINGLNITKQENINLINF